MKKYGKVFRRDEIFFVKSGDEEIEIIPDDELDITDSDRQIQFELENSKAKITHRYPKEHSLEWLSNSSEYPDDYYS